MNEQLQQAMSRMLDGLDATVTFLSGEIPDVIHQLLLWYAVKYGIEMLFGIAILVGYITVALWGFKKARAFESEATYSDSWLGYSTLAIASGAVGLLTLALAAYLINLQWLQILIAPKLWLIEYAAKLVK